MKNLGITLIIVTLFLFAPAAMTPTGYNPGLTPRVSVSTRIAWTVDDAPNIAFALFWSGTGAWIAEKDSQMIFDVTRVDDDIEGELTLGNATWTSNDTEIAMDLIIGVWGLTPWFPGFIVEIGDTNIEALNQTAYASAERVAGNYLNGTMESSYEEVVAHGTSYDCIIFEYEQDPVSFGEPQLTMLAYDLVTGVMVKANTSYSFGTPYSLVLELEGIYTPSVGPTPLLVGVAIALVVVLAVAIMKRRS
ncbi:MAG: hypothetical protein ACXAEE_09490 [Candidatus Thorarchaeota archaeon]|jgi:hypothetical protein